MCDYKDVEPTREIMKLWSINEKYTRNEIKYCKCKDGTIVPVDFKNWSKDPHRSYLKIPKSVLDNCPYDGLISYREIARSGMSKKMVDLYYDEMMEDFITYLKKLRTVKGDFEVKQLLGINSTPTLNAYLNKQRKIPRCCMMETLHDLIDTLDWVSPETVVKEEDAGYELMFIQRWYYRVLWEI